MKWLVTEQQKVIIYVAHFLYLICLQFIHACNEFLVQENMAREHGNSFHVQTIELC